MSVIRPLQPNEEQHICPDCGAPEGLYKRDDNHVACRLCDWYASETIGSVEIDDALSQSDPKTQLDLRDLRDFEPISYYVQNRDRVSVWGMAAYESALDHVRNREWDEAILDLRRALDMDFGLYEAHLWLGRLLQNDAEQREHLKKVSFRAEGLLELMYLDGQISLTQLQNALQNKQELQTRVVDDVIKSETTILTCPICGGDMTTHPITGHVECAYCGHILDTESEKIEEGQTVQTGMLLQQTVETKWVVNSRLIHCNNCGAERTLTDNQMGAYCLYCGSHHIVLRDALESFRAPDGIIPFTIPKEQADEAIQERLFARWERFKGVFVNNTVKQATLTGMYLPFWIFKIPLRKEFDYYIFPAVLSPSPRLIDKITAYDLSMIQSYTPSALARYSAEVYQVDFDKASLSMRSYLRRIVPDDNPFETTMVEVSHRWSIVNETTYQLILLPMWIATLIEDDDDVRIGLVNGQTGQAVLGKARKPRRYK